MKTKNKELKELEKGDIININFGRGEEYSAKIVRNEPHYNRITLKVGFMFLFMFFIPIHGKITRQYSDYNFVLYKELNFN